MCCPKYCRGYLVRYLRRIPFLCRVPGDSPTPSIPTPFVPFRFLLATFRQAGRDQFRTRNPVLHGRLRNALAKDLHRTASGESEHPPKEWQEGRRQQKHRARTLLARRRQQFRPTRALALSYDCHVTSSINNPNPPRSSHSTPFWLDNNKSSPGINKPSQ